MHSSSGNSYEVQEELKTNKIQKLNLINEISRNDESYKDMNQIRITNINNKNEPSNPYRGYLDGYSNTTHLYLRGSILTCNKKVTDREKRYQNVHSGISNRLTFETLV